MIHKTRTTKTTLPNILAAIVGYVRMGATIPQIVRLSGVSKLDIEELIELRDLALMVADKATTLINKQGGVKAPTKKPARVSRVVMKRTARILLQTKQR